jgi:predicted PurR-regulated permease PerM
MNLNLTTATRYGLNVLAALGASIALYLGRSIFIPLTIAGLLAAILWPATNWLHRRLRVSWFAASTVVITAAVLVVLLMFTTVGLSVPQILDGLPRPNSDPTDPKGMTVFYEQLRDNFKKDLSFFKISDPAFESAFPANPEDNALYREFRKFLQGEQITSLLLGLSGQGATLLAEAVLILFILLFLLVEGQMLTNKVRNIFGPGPEVQGQVSAALRETAESVRSYLVWRTIVNLGLGILLGAFYAAVGLKQWLLWGLLTALLGYVPYLGTIAAAVPPLLATLIDPKLGLWAAVGILVFYAFVTTLEGYIVVPWVMGRSMDLNATTVLLSCLFWYLIWGTAGLFLAMPLMAGIKAVVSQVPDWAPYADLMGSEESPPTSEEPVKLALAEASKNGDSQAVATKKPAPPVAP